MNVCSGCFLVIGEKEGRDAFFDAISGGAEGLRVGDGIGDADVVQSGENFYVISGEVSNGIGSLLWFRSEKEGVESIGLDDASKRFNVTIEAYVIGDEFTEHYIFSEGLTKSSGSGYVENWFLRLPDFKLYKDGITEFHSFLGKTEKDIHKIITSCKTKKDVDDNEFLQAAINLYKIKGLADFKRACEKRNITLDESKTVTVKFIRHCDTHDNAIIPHDAHHFDVSVTVPESVGDTDDYLARFGYLPEYKNSDGTFEMTIDTLMYQWVVDENVKFEGIETIGKSLLPAMYRFITWIRADIMKQLAKVKTKKKK